MTKTPPKITHPPRLNSSLAEYLCAPCFFDTQISPMEILAMTGLFIMTVGSLAIKTIAPRLQIETALAGSAIFALSSVAQNARNSFLKTSATQHARPSHGARIYQHLSGLKNTAPDPNPETSTKQTEKKQDQ